MHAELALRVGWVAVSLGDEVIVQGFQHLFPLRLPLVGPFADWLQECSYFMLLKIHNAVLFTVADIHLLRIKLSR